MHIQTHILSGWCIGNLVPGLGPRERALCMLAASLADVDGLGILVSEEWYWSLHHKLGHCAAFGLLLSGGLALVSTRGRRWLALGVYLALFHLHLVLDYLGSGPGWPLYYYWPVANIEWLNPHAWPFFSWQNLSPAFAVIGWAVWIAWTRRRTPLEAWMPSLDRDLVARLPPRRHRVNSLV
jgi:inner membrane protein